MLVISAAVGRIHLCPFLFRRGGPLSPPGLPRSPQFSLQQKRQSGRKRPRASAPEKRPLSVSGQTRTGTRLQEQRPLSWGARRGALHPRLLLEKTARGGPCRRQDSLSESNRGIPLFLHTNHPQCSERGFSGEPLILLRNFS